ncbi:hypothetical protein ABZW30_08190 [Kitasatospora sp. NPDC004669]|uniref:hypothetical protein n=1 Tax=Kitasatospora sp. NPDC004669 TaxID=3154555 RepID=UPI0033BF3786
MDASIWLMLGAAGFGRDYQRALSLYAARQAQIEQALRPRKGDTRKRICRAARCGRRKR